MLNEEIILSAIGSQEPSTFSEFCSALDDNCPEEKSEWAKLFRALEELQRHGFVEIEKTGGKVDTLILTEAGANRIREKLDSKRGLLTRMR